MEYRIHYTGEHPCVRITDIHTSRYAEVDEQHSFTYGYHGQESPTRRGAKSVER